MPNYELPRFKEIERAAEALMAFTRYKRHSGDRQFRKDFYPTVAEAAYSITAEGAGPDGGIDLIVNGTNIGDAGDLVSFIEGFIGLNARATLGVFYIRGAAVICNSDQANFIMSAMTRKLGQLQFEAAEKRKEKLAKESPAKKAARELKQAVEAGLSELPVKSVKVNNTGSGKTITVEVKLDK